MIFIGNINAEKGSIDFKGQSLFLFNRLSSISDNDLVLVDVEHIQDKNPRKMIAYFRLKLLPKVTEIIGEHRPMSVEIMLLQHFGIPNKPLDKYKFYELKYLIDVIQNFFEHEPVDDR